MAMATLKGAGTWQADVGYIWETSANCGDRVDGRGGHHVDDGQRDTVEGKSATWEVSWTFCGP